MANYSSSSLDHQQHPKFNKNKSVPLHFRLCEYNILGTNLLLNKYVLICFTIPYSLNERCSYKIDTTEYISQNLS